MLYKDIRQDPEYQALKRDLQNISPDRQEAFQVMLEEETRKEATPELISPQEFADKTGVHPATVRKWIREGTIKGKKIGSRKWFIPVTELEKALKV